MKIEIDINMEEANRPFTLRERISLHLLLIIFRLIFPAKYQHQMTAALEPFGELLKAK